MVIALIDGNEARTRASGLGYTETAQHVVNNQPREIRAERQLCDNSVLNSGGVAGCGFILGGFATTASSNDA